MVLLAVVAMAGMFILHGLILSWDRDIAGTVTVEIAAPSGETADANKRAQADSDKALALLRATPGIVSARAMTRQEMVALLAPWLGNGDLLTELPLPTLLDVTVSTETPPDLDALSSVLTKAIPGATLDDHRLWLGRLVEISRGIEAIALLVLMLIGFVTSAVVVYATRTGMAVHREIIEVLHMIGAPDYYIAGQFSARAFSLGLKGGLVGLILTLPVLGGILAWTGHLQGGFLVGLSLPVEGWIAILLIPAAAAILAMVTAYLTVHRALGSMT